MISERQITPFVVIRGSPAAPSMASSGLSSRPSLPGQAHYVVHNKGVCMYTDMLTSFRFIKVRVLFLYHNGLLFRFSVPVVRAC